MITKIIEHPSDMYLYRAKCNEVIITFILPVPCVWLIGMAQPSQTRRLMFIHCQRLKRWKCTAFLPTFAVKSNDRQSRFASWDQIRYQVVIVLSIAFHLFFFAAPIFQPHPNHAVVIIKPIIKNTIILPSPPPAPLSWDINKLPN